MEEKMKKSASYNGHIVAVPYPAQGHINPLLQLCKRVTTTHPNIKSTFVVTKFIAATLPATSSTHPSISIAAISDGFNSGGFSQSSSISSYLDTLQRNGRLSLSDLITRLSGGPTPPTCVVYDALFPWVLDVAKEHGLPAVPFFTQPCTVNYLYYLLHRGVWSVEEVTRSPVKVPGSEIEMETEDLPGHVALPESYPAYLQLLLNQHSNIDKADCILVNTFYELEPQVVDSMSKHTPLLPIGPTIPYFFLDQQDSNDKDYGLHLFDLKDSTTITPINWLNTKPHGSVIYVSFGSLSDLTKEQIDEMMWALKQSEYDFLWVLRATERPKLRKDIIEEMETVGKGMLVEWCMQLQVLAHEAIGCFVTHCGWNSTQEALSLGVPMVAIPQWADQPSNAKLVQDVWKTGIRAKADKNRIVPQEEIGRCLREVMCGDKGQEVRNNARKWKDLAKLALTPKGSSNRNIDIFLSKYVNVKKAI